MSYLATLQESIEKIKNAANKVNTEEATKNSLILPFFTALGYNVFDPDEFVPEYTADAPGKNGEKVDYAIMQDGKPIILIECKHVIEKLDNHHGQLFKYFNATPSARFGILTNGINYRFYTDLDNDNIMDGKPFLDIDLEKSTENQLSELIKFAKKQLDLEAISSSAFELKYTGLIQQYLLKQSSAPEDDFVATIMQKVYDHKKTQKAISIFAPLIKKSFQRLINEQVNARLQNAMDKSEESPTVETDPKLETDTPIENNSKPQIITTQDEINSFYMLKAILHDYLEGHELTYKDTLSYFSICLDNKVTKWVARLDYNANHLFVALPTMTSQKEWFKLNSIDELFAYKEDFIDSLKTRLK